MATSCSNYVAKTFLHAAGLLGVSAVGTQLPYMDEIIAKSQQSIFGKLLYLGVLLAVFLVMFIVLKPGGIPKYLLAIAISLYFGMVLRTDIANMVEKESLKRVLIITVAISLGMVALAFADSSGRYLAFYPVLTMGLLVLTGVLVFFYFTEKERPKWIEPLGAALFALFIAADTQLIRRHAKQCRVPADYINESYGLFLDVLNLFSFLGGSD
jgi:FtsH-binding integral membrane protein